MSDPVGGRQRAVAATIASESEVVVSRYPLRLEELIANACARVAGNLSDAEWKQHVGADVPYNATCPNARLPLIE